MEARIFPAVAALAAVMLFSPAVSSGSSTRTANFIVEAPTPELAEKIAKAAEAYRHDLAIEWLGVAMPNWSRPCPIVAQVAPSLGAGGATSFVFDKIQGRDEVFGWDMKIQGSEERILDSVLPHEVTHTIFASHFRRPLPRWADEGACTTVEHISERNKQQIMLVNFLRTNHGIAFDKLFAMKDYPPEVLPLYSEGYSLARFLIDQWGRKKFLEFVGEGLQTENWPVALKKEYGFPNLQSLQDNWLDWVKQGSPTLLARNGAEVLVADRSGRSSAEPVYRAQSDDRDAPAARSSGRATSGTAGSSNAAAADRSNSAAADTGWSPAPNTMVAAGVAAEKNLSDREGARTASNDGAAGNGSNSVYDRPTAADRPSNVPDARSGMASTSPANALVEHQPELVAQRTPPAANAQDHRVLLEWSQPQ
jgi:hypothetical protein